MSKNIYLSQGSQGKLPYSQYLALESRLVFDGAAAATVADVQNMVDAADSAEVVESPQIESQATISDFIAVADPVNAVVQSTAYQAENTHSFVSIVFVDSAVLNPQDIISTLPENAEIVYLDANRDGLSQMADYLSERSDIASIHVISHAQQDALHLGNETFTDANLSAYTEQLSKIGHSLQQGGDILLYGCQLAGSVAGKTFVDSFSYLTNADVAASIDDTGASARGGNWSLEYRTGNIEASMLAATQYQNLLAGVETTVSTVALSSNAGGDGVYTTGEVVSVDVTFNGVETVTGTPIITLNIGGQLRTASYVSGSGTNTLRFNYTVVNGDTDANGISIEANSLALNGGMINNIDFAATLYHNAVADNALHPVSSSPDTTAPVFKSAVANGTNLTITYNEIGSGLDAGSLPLVSDFIVTRNGGTPITVTGVSINSVAQTVDLTLGSVINTSDTDIRISYTKSGTTDIQDSQGNKVANLANQAVSNTMPTFDLKQGKLLFNDPIIQVGTGQNAGDIVLFNNAVTLDGQAIDVIVTTVSNNNTSITGFDSASGTLAVSIDEYWFELNTNIAAANGSSTIKFDFIKHGTYNAGTGVKVLLQNVMVNSYDIDNYQFQEFGGFASYTLSNSTKLSVTNLANNFVRFTDTTLDDDTSDIGTLGFDEHRVTALYKEISSFQIKTGATTNLNAYFFIDFSGGPNWNAPITYDIPTVVPQTTDDFTPTITGTYAPNVQGSTDTAISLSVTVNGVTYTAAEGLVWSGGTWSLTIPPGNALLPGTYDVVVDTGYGPLLNNHTQDATVNELVIVNRAPVNTVPSSQTVATGVATPIPNLSVTDANGNLATTRLSVTSGRLNVDLSGGATISSGQNGTDTLTLSGTETQIKQALASLTYIANTGTSADTLTIFSTDTLSLTDTDTVNIIVNTPPVANNDTNSGNVGKPITVNVLNNDNDPDGTLVPSTVKITGTNKAGDPLVVLGQGTWSINPTTGAITFTPETGFTGTPTPISYTVQDNQGFTSNPATVTLTINQPPVANSDTQTGDAGVPITINVINNDSDPNGNLAIDTIKIVGTSKAGDPLVVPGQGTWSINPTTGAITFTPETGFTGTPTPISYTIKDTDGLESAPATVTLIIQNRLPVAVIDVDTAVSGGPPIRGNVILNEQNLGDEPTKVLSASQGNRVIRLGEPFITAAGGILILNSDGSYSYTPPSLFYGNLVENFSYTIIDVTGDTSSSVLTISVRGLPLTSGSLINLSNPSTILFPDIPRFTAATLPELPTVFDFSLYIPSLDGIIWLTGSLRNQVVLEQQFFSFDIPKWSFWHTNPNAQLEFEVSRPDGSALPEWLKFNPKLLRFSGIPPKGAQNEQVMVTVRDNYGNEAHAIFSVYVNKERARPDHKVLSIDTKLLKMFDKLPEKKHKEKNTAGKQGLSEKMRTVGKFSKLQETRTLLKSLKDR